VGLECPLITENVTIGGVSGAVIQMVSSLRH